MEHYYLMQQKKHSPFCLVNLQLCSRYEYFTPENLSPKQAQPSLQLNSLYTEVLALQRYQPRFSHLFLDYLQNWKSLSSWTSQENPATWFHRSISIHTWTLQAQEVVSVGAECLAAPAESLTLGWPKRCFERCLTKNIKRLWEYGRNLSGKKE